MLWVSRMLLGSYEAKRVALLCVESEEEEGREGRSDAVIQPSTIELLSICCKLSEHKLDNFGLYTAMELRQAREPDSTKRKSQNVRSLSFLNFVSPTKRRPSH